MNGRNYATIAVLAICLAAGARGYAQPAPAPAPVTREEFDRAMKEIADLRKEVADLKAERAAAATQPAATAGGADVAQLRQEVATLKKQQAENQADADERMAETEKLVKDVMAKAQASSLGETKLLITGDASVGFTSQKNNTSTFSAGVSPRLLWKINDRLQFDAAMDIGLDRNPSDNSSETTFDLTIASVTYLLNDYMVIGAGKFVAPFAAYHRDFDPPWIDKLPDDPLVFSDNGLAPGSILGAFVSGGVPVGSAKFNYAAYVSNGPELSITDPATAGSLMWDNNVDLNNNKAVGGRIGFLPIPQLEIGYSVLYGQASPGGNNNPTGFPTTKAFLQAVDFNYTRSSELLAGAISLRSEWVWSKVGDATYDPNGTWTPNPGPLTFNNARNGGYAQFSYRPTLSGYKVLRNFEGVFRYDRLDGPSAAPSGGGHEQRYTFGVDYWLDSRSVLKFAYECDDVSNAGGSPAYMMQFGVGF